MPSVLFRFQRPSISGFSEFLTADECAAIIEAARPRMARSTTLSRASGEHEVIPTRTSAGCFLNNADLPLLDAIDARIAAHLGLRRANAEWLQVLRYGVGDEYQPHHDFFEPSDPGSQATLQRGGQRVATLIMYLNTPSVGGETLFPVAGLSMTAAAGRAVAFHYPSCDPALLHGGAPVLAGEKWAATRWYREGEFR